MIPTLWRWFVFAVAFAASASGVWLLACRAVDVAGIGEVPTAFGLHDTFEVFKKQLPRVRGKERVFLIGDSTMGFQVGMKAPRRQVLPARIAEALHKYGARGERIDLKPFTVPGLGPAGLYLVSQELVDAHPDRVVMSLNLRSFGADWFHQFSYAESAGWMAPAQLLEAMSLPLFHGGLTADRILFYRALVSCGAGRTWPAVRRLQGRAFKLRGWLAIRADAATFGTKATEDMQAELGLARWVRLITDVDKLPRMTKTAAERSLAPLLRGVSPNHPTLRILSAVLDRFDRAGIPVLVYATPINVEYLRSMGLPMHEVERSMQTVARVVRQHGAQFVDFHAVLPERSFLDPGDHFTFDGQPNGTFRLASLVAAALVKSLPPDPDQYVVQ